MITFEDVENNDAVRTYIRRADQSLGLLGYTEHSFTHVTRVAHTAAEILTRLGYEERDIELARIAAYLHDIGNIINRTDHAQSGAVMAFRILDNMGMSADDTATVISAIGNHDESTAVAVGPVDAALIIGDKTDVRRSRVRNTDISTFDIHDRVNFSVTESSVVMSEDNKEITLVLKIDTGVCSVMDYFEIFLGRMILCRKAAERLDMRFRLLINGRHLL